MLTAALSDVTQAVSILERCVCAVSSELVLGDEVNVGYRGTAGVRAGLGRSRELCAGGTAYAEVAADVI